MHTGYEIVTKTGKCGIMELSLKQEVDIMEPEDSKTPFARWVQVQIERAGGYRKAAEQAGVSHATLQKVVNGGTVSLNTVKALAEWRNVSLTYLLRLYGEEFPEERELAVELDRVLRTHPELRNTLEVAVEVLGDEEMAEILHFIQFQIDRRR
jgi:transcriptional regulator with XRE-family HTH domain